MSKTFTQLLADFEEAVHDNALKGCGRPEDIPEIEARLEATRSALTEPAIVKIGPFERLVIYGLTIAISASGNRGANTEWRKIVREYTGDPSPSDLVDKMAPKS